MAERGDFVLGTAGHIDHGKTALVRALTGIDTDRLPAEKQRGITIDLGFASLDLGRFQIALIDVPGHERFIRNMLAGATGLDMAMLVVAADDSVMPQTREHLDILKLLGLQDGLIVVTKCDLVDAVWLEMVKEEVRAAAAGSFLEHAPMFETSAPTGKGIAELREGLISLCERASTRSDPGLFRMAADRSFSVSGHGTVVTGTVASGSISIGDELELLPSGKTVRVRGLQRHDKAAESISRGARAAINLAGVHHTEVKRGDELASPGYLVPSRILSVELRASPEAPRTLKHRSRYRVHLGTSEITAKLSVFGANEVSGDEPFLGQLFLSEPAVAYHGEPFILREESPPTTLGGGRVLQPASRRIRRRDEVRVERLGRLRSEQPKDRVLAALAFQGLAPWTDRSLSRETGISVADAIPTVSDLTSSGELVEVSIGMKRSQKVIREVLDELEGRILRALARHHQENPRLSAISRSKVINALADVRNDPLVAGVIERLRIAKKLSGTSRTVALPGYEPKLSQGERRLKNEIAEGYRAAGFTPPETSDWASKAGGRAAVVPEILAILLDEEQIVEISPDYYLDFEAEAEMRRRVVDRLKDDSGMTMADLRDLLGITRKYAVPFGEYLDRIGLTHRDGDLRRLKDAEAVSRRAPNETRAIS